jgi:anti-sigma B factor antagonist
MELWTRSNGNVIVLALSGRFDKYSAPPVAEWIEQAAAMSHTHIIVNLADVPFIDSTGLATLVQGLKRCQQRRGELSLCGLQRPVYMIFELTRLDKAFNIFVDEDHAIQALTGS